MVGDHAARGDPQSCPPPVADCSRVLTLRRVPLPDEKPVLPAALVGAPADSDQGPPPGELPAYQLEDEVAPLEAFMRVPDRRPRTEIPDPHGTSTVLAFRNRSLEGAVLDRVVLHLNGESPLPRIRAQALRDGPALQYTVQLQAEVVMQPRGSVLLDHEPPPLGGLCTAPGLGRTAEIPLSSVGAKSHDLGVPRVAPGARRRMVP